MASPKAALLLLALTAVLPPPATSQSPTGSRGKTVSTVLSAKWQSTPFVLEMAEALQEEAGSEAFWDMVDFISEAEGSQKTDKELYDQGMEFCSRYLSWTQLQMLKLSLSLRSYSPRLETFQQIAGDLRGLSEQGCDHVVHFGGKLSCSADVATSAPASDAPSVRLFKIDHVHPHHSESAPVAVLYGQPGVAGFREVHGRLAALAAEGRVRYVLRPYLRTRAPQQTRLSGYGVELQIKKTEYKAQDDAKIEGGQDGDDGDADADGGDEVEGFVFDTLRERHPDKAEKLGEFRAHLVEQKNDLAPMKVWQLQDLSLQTAQRVMKAESPEDQLRLLADLSQDFPSYAKKLSKIKVSKEVKKEAKKNSEAFMMNMNVQPGDAALFVNGMYFDMDYVDVFTIMDSLKSDGRVLDGLGKLGLTDKQAARLMSQDFSGSKQTYGIDIRDSAVSWVNDIESDKVYKSWGKDLTELLRPTFPGMLRSIRRNLFNVVILCDPSSKEARPLLKLLESFYVHRAPTRIGIIFKVNDDPAVSGKMDAGVALLDAYNYIAQEKEPYDALAFMTDVFSKLDDSESLTPELVIRTFKSAYGRGFKEQNVDEVFEEDSEYDVGRQLAKDFVSRSGFKSLPQVLMNGVPLESKHLTSEDFEEGIMMALMKSTNELQRAVYRNQLREDDDVVDWLMKQPGIMPRLNDRVLKSDDAKYIDLGGDEADDMDNFQGLPKPSMASTLAKSLPYLTQKEDSSKRLKILTVWVAADLETARGREVLSAAVSHLKGSSLLRVGVVHNTARPGAVSRAVQAALETLDNAAAKHLIKKVVKEDTVRKLESGKKALTDYDIPGADMAKLQAYADGLKDSPVFSNHAKFCASLLEAEPGAAAVVVNGKVIGPLEEDEVFAADDFNLLEKFTMAQYGEKMVTNFHSFMDVKAAGASDVAMKTVALLLTRTETRSRQAVTAAVADKHSVIKLEPQFPDRPAFDIVAVVDPVSRGAQKIAPLLLALKDVLNAKVSVFLNCVEKHSEMPQKSYFRTVLDTELRFDAGGKLTQGPSAKFTGLPEETILTMHHHIPDNWLIEPVKSVYDLDNIKLSAVEGSGVYSEFELEYLLLEGHCFEAFTGNPPRGLQLTLGTDQKPVVMDTIVMANLGYLQLKSSPGRWIMNLREGRSSELYDIVSHEGTEEGDADSDGQDGEAARDIQVLIDSFKTKIVKLRVQKKADKRDEDLLEGDAEPEEDGGLWGSLTKTLTGSPSDAGSDGASAEEEPLNIFCLASGHLYERLLKIMMQTTIRHTKAPVKFWILKNYLSPSLKEFLPYYAAKYGFEYEYVQYKWPRWLNQQKEKQRIIWGYKILFLDVMFPLDVKKIIFVDTDQIVRADLTELRDMDLKGAPYGYTPFCDSNQDMEGFRFWKQGYWKNHLAGRPYHISALYVVDLVRFRRIAAGDRLRGQYQALSQDPNSLSNLDQDLPNNMIHQVPIFSLPQDWLWCETWCDQTSKKTAKNIDLCNNPLTKESKLDAARRIVAEWTDIDDEITSFWEEEKKKIKGGQEQLEQEQEQESHHQDKHTEL